MSVTAIIAFDCAVLGPVLRGRPLFGLDGSLDMGLLPTVTVFSLALFSIVARRGKSRPFIVGFAAAGWVSVLAYVATCRIIPEVMAIPVMYYINDIEPRFMDAATLELYSLSLMLMGLIWAVPQLIIALVGGVLAMLVAPRRVAEAAGPLMTATTR
jgi:hypothetical protein